VVPEPLIVENYAFVRYAAAQLIADRRSRQKRNLSAQTFDRRQLLKGAIASALPLALGACAGDKSARQEPLIVGGLPVTCNLTLPVACTAKDASLKAGSATTDFRFEYSKYSGWPEIKESLMAGRIQAGYMLAPLVMDLADKKIPVKVVSLGHRSGAVIMVRTDSPYQRFADLKGKRVAIPSRFAVDFLFLRKMLARENMMPKDIEIMEMPPPDMPAALYANAVDAYCTGEPFGAAAQRAGYARVLRMTRDEWRNYICCVLTVRQELIDEQRPMVQDLVNQIQGAGIWLDQTPENRTKAVAIASGKDFFNQDPKILQYVMDNPVDRVTYGDLRMIREEFEDLMQLSIEAGTIKHPIPYEKYIDDSFVRATKAATIPL
jgi:NitT/TauT family transport system substrate-binding protein